MPNDPVVAARVQSVNDSGGNAFYDYQVPSAVIALKQRVLEYFTKHRIEYRQTALLRPQVGVSLLAFAACWYVTYVLGFWLASVPMGLISCALVGGLGHEYSHSTLTKSDNRPGLLSTLCSMAWALVFPFMPEK